MKRLIVLAAAIFLFTTQGCGYSLRSLLPSEYHHISVESFSNSIDITQEREDIYRYRTFYPNIEADVTQEVIRKFGLDGRLTISGQEDADLVMSGKVVDFMRQPLRMTDDERTEEYRIVIIADVSLRDTRKNTYLWQEPQLEGEATYMVGRSNEADAIKLAIEDLATRIVERTIENW
jgi:hypothetical protein